MALLKDIVDTCDTDGGQGRTANPVLRLVDQFTGDKSLHQDRWRHEDFRAGPPRPGMPPQVQLDPRQRQVNQFFNPDEFERFSGNDLADAFESMDFRHDEYGPPPAFREAGPRYGPGPRPGFLLSGKGGRLSAFEQERMRSRFEEEDEAPLALRQPGPKTKKDQFAELDGDFMREYEQALRAPGPRERQGQAPNEFKEWDELFSKPPPNAELWSRQFRQDHDPELEEYEEIFRRQTEEKRATEWVDDFSDPVTSEKLDREVAAEADLRETAKRFAAIDDPKMQNSEFFKLMQKLSTGEVTIEGDQMVQREKAAGVSNSSGNWADEFDTQQNPMVDEFSRFEDEHGNPLMKDWINQYEESMNDEARAEMEEAWKQHDFETSDAKLDRPYEFQQNNPFLKDPKAFELGVQLFKDGNITEAILAFEGAVQQKLDFSLAWQYLGQAQAENDKDDLASMALVQAVRSDPDNQDALISLAVSYTNDFHKERALECLHQWIAAHPEYAKVLDAFPADLPQSWDQSHRMVTDMLIAAARLRPYDPDPDVQSALGLMYNLSFEYDKAIDCFKAAVAKKPDEYLLWNKLGATQANSMKNEEAIEAYFRALEIKPSYTRARSNLGISFLALRHYGEAAKAFLGALSINPSAKHIWDNLRTVFSLMDRTDLVAKCDLHDVREFMDEFNF